MRCYEQWSILTLERGRKMLGERPLRQGGPTMTTYASSTDPATTASVRIFADLVVGVFDADDQAERALRTFRREGFGRDEIGLAMRTDDLIVQEDALAAVDAADRGLPVALREMGVPEREALQYQRDFESGRSIVTIRAAGRTRHAETLLRRACTH
jgi:hypothetical protein